MSTTRRKFSKEFKSKVVLDSLKERETLESLAKKYELTPTQLSTYSMGFSDLQPCFDWQVILLM
ncbi:MAG: transposase [Paludibacter sp.]|nr:transposase [Paludibacter sp.]MDD4427658.1 transposase [Paludibacter sp.]